MQFVFEMTLCPSLNTRLDENKTNYPCNVTFRRVRVAIVTLFFFFFPIPPHVLMNFRGFCPGCGDSVADLGRP